MVKQTRFAKVVAGAAGLSMAFSATLPVAAVTTAELQAQIAALMAQLSAMTGGSACANFTMNLTVGSTGSEVVALQQLLVSKGYLTMPAGVAYGYFGGLTKAGVARWQASVGISPAVGYFGPISRAAANVCAATPATPGTTTGGTTAGGSAGTTGGVITTPGAEGTLTVETAPVSNSTVYEGDMNAAILSFKAKAASSDIALQRVKLDLGTATTLYNKVLSKITLVDDQGRILASSNTNSTTVIKDSSNYYLTLTGFSSVIPMGSSRVYTVKADIQSQIDSGTTSGVINLAQNAVRGVDGAGIDLYGPTTAFSRTFTVGQSLVDSAAIVLSTAGNTPLSQEVVASTGVNKNEADKVTLLNFDIKANKDSVKVTDLVATVTSTGPATASTTYLYAGSQLLGTASLSGSTATFSTINFTIPKDATQNFTLSADVRGATSAQTTITSSVATTGVTAENSVGDSITSGNKTGSATGNTIYVRNVGPVITLSGTPTISKSAMSGAAVSTSSALANFNVTVKAVGGDLYFGTQAASSTFGFQTYVNGAATTILVASSTSWSVPSSGVVTSGMTGANAFRLQENNSVTIPVSFYFEGRTTASALVTSGAYAVGLESVKWSATGNDTQTSNFMAGKTAWRTAEVIMP